MSVEEIAEKSNVAVIGLGSMGFGMASSLMRCGHAVVGYDPSAKATEKLAATGARIAKSPGDASANASVVLCVVVNSAQTDAVLFGDGGVFRVMAPDSVFISSATMAPSEAKRLSSRLAEREILYLDAPISGGAAKAASGALTIMASGSPNAFARVQHVLDAIAAKVYRLGDEPGIGAALIECRLDHPTWGPKKLKAFLERRQPRIVWPAASTIGEVLKRRGLVGKRRRRRSALPLTRPFAPIVAANQTWSVDFKGWFRTRDGKRCDPLTVSDALSRYLVGCRICAPTGIAVEVEMDRLLKEFGLPDRFRLDNGSPWGSTGAGGLTALSVKWLKLGIGLEFITPASPQENARHERMHGTLKADTLRPPAATPADQQRRFDAFRESYNGERPHEALGQETPASRYEPSPRPYPRRVEAPVHEGDAVEVRRVRGSGEIKWRGGRLFIGEAFSGETVALSETETGDHRVRFMSVDLGLIDRNTGKFRRFGPPRPRQTKTQTTNADSKNVNHVPGP